MNNFCSNFNKIRIIYPEQKLTWDCIHLIVILMGFILIPLHITFHNYIKLNGAGSVFLIIFVIDILISLNTSFYNQGKLIEDRGEIFRHYLSKKSFNDLITILPIAYHVLLINESSAEDSLLKIDLFLLFYFLKYSNFSNLKRKVQESLDTTKTFRYYLDLF